MTGRSGGATARRRRSRASARSVARRRRCHLGIGRFGRQAQPFDDRQHRLRVGGPGVGGELDLVRAAVAVLGEELVEAVDEVGDVAGRPLPASRSRSQQPVDALVERRGERCALPRPVRPSRHMSTAGLAVSIPPMPGHGLDEQSGLGPLGALREAFDQRRRDRRRRSPPRAALGAAPPSSARTRPPGRRPRRRSGRSGIDAAHASRLGPVGVEVGPAASEHARRSPTRPGPWCAGCGRPDHAGTVAPRHPRTSAGRRRRRACRGCGRRTTGRTTG